jgi:CheY-like chemotaxis protein
MVEFNIKEAGNELLKTLEDELLAKKSCRLTIDVLIPENLFGDKNGLCNSIILISKFLDRNIAQLIIDIELLLLAKHQESILLNIEVKGSNSALKISGSRVLKQAGVEKLLMSLPYPTSYVKKDLRVHFNFKMTFQYLRDRRDSADLFNDRSILLAEDNDISALIFITFLEEWGCIVTRVKNGQLAIDEAKKKPFDLILVDIHMRGISGNESIQKIREFDPHVPVIGITTASTIHGEAAMNAGANNIITKPVDADKLRKILRQYLAPNSSQSQD